MVYSQNVQQCISVLLDKGVPVDCQDTQGCIPLHYAAQLPSKCTRNMVSGRHPYKFCGDHYHVYAKRKGLPCTCHMTIYSPLVNPSMLCSLFPDNLVACTLLLDHGADPNAKDNDQLTALHTAARAGLAENCQFLLEHTKGHLGNEVDAQGQSALHHAVSCDGVECVAYLLSIGLAANQLDLEMRTYV